MFMDPIRNPFSPGAGSPPPELVGRDPVLDEARVLLGRVRLKRPDKSMMLTGLRGVGKTVLLNEIERIAQAQGYHTVSIEAHEDKALGPLLALHLRRILFDMNRLAGAGDKVMRSLAILRGFIGSLKLTVNDVSIGLDILPETGTADSGDLEVDLPNLFVAIGEAAEDRNTAIAILIDEIQYFRSTELGALIMAMHKVQQRQLPLLLIGAGLPILPALAGDSKSYAERLFSFPNIGALSESDVAKALQDPAREAGVTFDADALKKIFELTRGYPYFVQEWAYQSWNAAAASPITLADVQVATNAVIPRLDQNFFRVRYDRLTPAEKRFLRAMASLGPGPYRSGDIPQALGVKQASIGPIRSALINKGMIYSPTYGIVDFTVPLFDQFMIRAMPEFTS